MTAGLAAERTLLDFEDDDCRTWKHVRNIRVKTSRGREDFSNHGVRQLADGRIIVAYQHFWNIDISVFTEEYVRGDL